MPGSRTWRRKEWPADGRYLPRIVPQDRPGQAARIPQLLRWSAGPEVPEGARGCRRVSHRERPGERLRGPCLPRWLGQSLAELEASGSSAFRDATQVRAVLDAALVRLPAAYREHHADLLAHQPDADLFVPFFLARACEAVLRQGAPWEETRAARRGGNRVSQRLRRLPADRAPRNAPEHRVFPHEKVRPVPLFLKGAGVAPGRTPTSFGPRSNCWRRPIQSCSKRRASLRTIWTNSPSTRGHTTTSTRSTSGRTCCSANGIPTRSTAGATFAASCCGR